MKKHSFIFISIVILLALIVFTICFKSTSSFKYDNTILINDMISRLYSKEQIEKLEQDVLKGNIGFRQFNINYRPQCIRKTHQGYYAVLVQDDGYLCFVFWNSKNEIYSIYRTEKFISSNEFMQNIVIGETNVDNLIDDGMDFFYFPISKRMMTGHVCHDGVIIIQYNAKGTVEQVKFFSNEELIVSNEFPMSFIPYILPQDRTHITHETQTQGDG